VSFAQGLPHSGACAIYFSARELDMSRSLSEAAHRRKAGRMVSKKSCFAVAALTVTLALNGSSELAGQSGLAVESGELWFVELDTSLDTFRARAKDSAVDFTERYVYQRVWKGVSVRASADAAASLGRLRGVKAVFPVLNVELEPVDTASPELLYALAMTGADVAQQNLGLSGAGVKVGVIDTGVDYDHPDLGGGFGPGSRVVTGYDFVGNRYSSSGSGGALKPHPDKDPDDCNGHGTHVAGIIGANGDPDAGGVRGVAPGVTFGAYRVFGCEGTTHSDIMLAAMERALADGMDVVNMSIGSAFQTWPQYPTAVGADALVDAGVVVVTSIGNSGANGVYSASAPGVGRKVIGTASFDNTHVELALFRVSPDARAIGFMPAAAAPDPPTQGSVPLARTGTPASDADACLVSGESPLPAGSLAGKIALIRRGTCGFYEKSMNAQNAGAVGVVLYNNVAGLLTPTVAPVPPTAPPITIPVVFVQAVDGVLLNDRIASDPTTLTWTDEREYFVNPTAGRSSSFTSFGLTAELDLKPNIGAPGGAIRSTYPLEAGGYAVISGTSMASPHVAGAAALFLEAHPTASPAAVKTALQNSADLVPHPTLSNPDFVHRQGAGMVDIDDAITATTTVTPSELSVGEGTSATPKMFELTIANNSTGPITYTLSHQPALPTLLSTFSPSTTTSPLGAAVLSFAPSSLTLPAGAMGNVNVTITPPPNTGGAEVLDKGVYGGSIVVAGEGRTYGVPYAGFIGDYQSIQVLASLAASCPLSPFPWIFKVGGETICVAATPTAPAVTIAGFTRQAEGATYNIEDRNDRPVILYHRAHQSRRLEIRAIDVATNQTYPVAAFDYLTRNATSTGLFSYTWDGKTLFTNPAGKVHRKGLPDGAYTLQIVVTKALAEPNNPAHIETWTSPTMNITHVSLTTQ
jgi:minor extracellular serine protease Vpr